MRERQDQQDSQHSPARQPGDREEHVGGRSPSPGVPEREAPQQPHALTRKMSVAASSPSRAPLEIVRRVPPAQPRAGAAEKASGLDDANRDGNSRRSSQSERAALHNNNQSNTDGHKQDSPVNGGQWQGSQYASRASRGGMSPQSQDSPYKESREDSQGANDELIKIASEEGHDIPAFGGTEDRLQLTRKSSVPGADEKQDEVAPLAQQE